MVAAGVAREMLVQLSYAIGIAKPVSIFVNTYGTAASGLDDGVIASKIAELFDLRPAAIIRKFNLKMPIYEPTAAYGHVGRKPFKAPVTVTRDLHDGKGRHTFQTEAQFFGWELLDAVGSIREAFKL